MTTTPNTAAKPAVKKAAKPAAKPAAKVAAKPAAKPATKPAAKVTPKVVKAKPAAPRAYSLVTGPDDSTFCERVSAKLANGYELYGSPSVTFNGKTVIAAQAVVLKKKGKKK